MIRSFLAIELPEDQKETVAEYIQELRQVPSKIKWVLPHQTHFTLKFFGSIMPETVKKIAQDLSPVLSEFPKFHLTLKGIGAFPNLFRPRVVWLGLGGETDSLQGIHQVIDQALIPLGIPKEERPFQGHLTLGRNKENQINESVYRHLSEWSKEETAPFAVEKVFLFQSDLKPAGPVYTKLEAFPLKKALQE
ncbi:MAG: RNA 2',3'-cyclic phosphodiesterase [Thermodesulfobacteriota bacterium]|jgi:2'-5' RNA ligase